MKFTVTGLKTKAGRTSSVRPAFYYQLVVIVSFVLLVLVLIVVLVVFVLAIAVVSAVAVVLVIAVILIIVIILSVLFAHENHPAFVNSVYEIQGDILQILKNKRYAFSLVIFKTSSFDIPLILPIFSAIYGIREESLRLPLIGSGAR